MPLPRHETSRVYEALRERYPAPEYALFFEVANGTGAQAYRFADAMAMSLFPSRGLRMHGFEVKVSRGDWQRELSKPQKVEEGNYRFCDHWWIVAPAEIIRPGELPPMWGHLEVSGTETLKLRIKVNAPALTPEPMSRSFIAAFLRRADEANRRFIDNQVHQQTRELRERLDKVTQDNQTAIDEAVEERTKIHRGLVDRVREFEAASGISLIHHYGFDPGAARLVKALGAAGLGRTYGGLEDLAKRLETSAAGIREHLTAFDALAPAKAEDAA
jgi:hypothetical protein